MDTENFKYEKMHTFHTWTTQNGHHFCQNQSIENAGLKCFKSGQWWSLGSNSELKRNSIDAAIVYFMITAKILVCSLANFYRQ